MGLWEWLFGKKKEEEKGYAAGSYEVSRAFARNVFASSSFEYPGVLAKDQTYLLLQEDKLKDFVEKYWDVTTMSYHSESDEFPDCDDFAVITFSGMIRGAIKEGFKYPPLFGEVSYKKKSGGYHRVNWAVASPDKLMFFEPQTGKWFKDFSDVEFLTNVEI